MTDTTDDRRTANSTDESSSKERARLEEYTTELQHVDPLAEFARPDAMADILADSRIVALGEATHGTREFFRLKHRFLRYLVLEHDVRVFAMEANFPETLAIDEYVVHGTGDPREALQGIYFWTWNVEAVLSMIEWMREFNEGRPLEDCVRFYGFDAQYTTGAVSRLESFLDAVDGTVSETIQSDLELVDDEGTNPDNDDRTQERFEAAERVVPALRDHLDEHRETDVSREGERSFELAHRYLRLIEQAMEYRLARSEYDGGFSGDLTDEQREALEEVLTVRDRAMADTVDWLLEFEDLDRIVLWAHDAHVNRERHAVRGTGAVAEPMGSILADRHGEEYRPVGFSFGRGSFQALGQTEDEDGESTYGLQEQALESPVSGTIDEALAGLDVPLGLVDLRSARADDELGELLDTPQPHFSLGATYEPPAPEDHLTEYTYGDAFDAVCYVDETTRARPVGSDDFE